MSAGRFLRRTLRGARLVELGALTVVLGLALAVYMVKARAGREAGDIVSVENQISDEQRRVRLLQAEVAHLEQPARLEKLAEIVGVGPTSDKRETSLDRLPDIARQSALAAPEAAKAPSAPIQPQPGALR
ncbi:MAG TPA: cell division protein [Caulobacteraceae bacterium]|nr:cell division protein [Caulobacteraceae bacterium]